MKKKLLLLLFVFLVSFASAQKASVSGVITYEDNPVPFTNVYIKGTSVGTMSDIDGKYTFEVSEGSWNVSVQIQAYRSQTKKITIAAGESQNIDFTLTEDALGLEEIVVSATRNRISKKEAPVIVNVLGPKLFSATQSLSLADGLNYQPGVRVETNCQNCGFTQVRLNGLGGEYTQILVNSKPVFSALNGVYGLEQIPVSIIDRVEVVRSGGSALFGSNAIAGTINVIGRSTPALHL
jgi:outer membrane receptor for ferrienterochelin and colicins